jgi:hypothetical protein
MHKRTEVQNLLGHFLSNMLLSSSLFSARPVKMSSSRCTSATDVIYRDIDIFGTKPVYKI